MVYNDPHIQGIKIRFAEREVTATCQKFLSREPRKLIFSFVEAEDARYIADRNGKNPEIEFRYDEKSNTWRYPKWIVRDTGSAVEDFAKFLNEQNLRPLPPIQP